MKASLTLAAAALVAFAACAGASTGKAAPATPAPAAKAPKPYPLPPGRRYTTLSKTWLPTNADAQAQSAIFDRLLFVDDLPLYDAYGLTDLTQGPGEPHVLHTELAAAPTTGTRRSLLYFVQFSDLHMVDEESPIRLEGVTGIAYASAYRAQDHLTAQLLDSLFRTVNAFSFADRPFDFAFTTGDIADTGQLNEVQWIEREFEGGTLTPDSGRIDDPVPGPANDFADPFTAAGLDKRVPWLMLFGNHDQMHLGSFDPTPAVRAAAVGDRITDLWNLTAFTGGEMTWGARDASRPYAPVLRDGARIAADAARKLVTPQEFMAAFVGHGFTQTNVDTGETSYVSRPVKGFPLVVVALDTIMEMKLDAEGNVVQHAGSEAEVSRATWAGFVIPALDAAQAAGDLVIFASHHCSEAIMEGVSEIDRAEFRATLKKYPNLIAHLCGHGHRSRAWFWAAGPGEAHGYPELMQASAIDFPIAARVLELVDNGDGTLSLFTTQVEPNVAPGSLAYEGLAYAAAAHNFPPASLTPPFRWYGDKPYRNMEIVIPVPAGFDVAALPARGAIESVGRLANP
jgi:3',5'-cyclic AMP phosphodiesterase CpdA